jgi:hypothetical protein
MRIRACKKPSKTIKFGSKSIKKATFSVKKGPGSIWGNSLEGRQKKHTDA